MPPPEATAPSLRRTLFRALLPLWLVILALSCVVTWLIAAHFVRDVHDRWLSDSVHSLSQVAVRGDAGLELPLSEPAGRLFTWDAEDRTWFRLESPRRGTVAGNAEVPLSGAGVAVVGDSELYDGMLDGQPVRVARLRLGSPETGETATLAVAETVHKRTRTTRDIVLTLLLPELLLAALAAALVAWGVRRSVDPLRALAARLGEQSHATLKPLPLADAPLEVRPLIVALNEVLLQLDRRMSDRQAFIAAAAHDLRTPLAAALLHLDQARGADPASVQALATVRGAVRRAVRAARQVLDYSSAEAVAVDPGRRSQVDLCEVARQIGAEFAPAAVEKSLGLSLDLAAERIVVPGVADLLAAALGNLLDNAVKYTPSGGHVVVSVLDAPHAGLRVADDGPGIEPALRGERASQRFARGARALDAGIEGAGLGLAIAREVAARHDGHLELGAGPDGRGTVATLWLGGG